MQQKQRYLHLIAMTIWIGSSYYLFTSTIPVIKFSGEEELSFRWTDRYKIDGGTIKGFVETSSKEQLYITYRFTDEQEKVDVEALHLPATKWTVAGHYKEQLLPAHQYSFNMNHYLKQYGASGHFQVEEVTMITIKETVTSRLAAQRAKMKKHIEATFPEKLQTEAKALLIGDRSAMNDEEALLYRTLGITHLFAISGLHIGLLTLIVRELLFRLSVRREAVDLLLITFLPIYAVIAGGAPSVWRAVSVTVFLLMLQYTPVRLRLDDALALSALFFLTTQPHLLFQAGFQLSYGVAFALIYSSTILTKIKSLLSLSFHVTFISQVALYPILLFHFYELSLSSFFVNILYVPLYSIVILPMNMMLFIVTSINQSLAVLIFAIYEPLRELITRFSYWLATIPYQLWNPGKPSFTLLVVAVISVVLFFIFYEQTGLFIKGLPILLIPALVIHFAPYFNSELRVTYLAVGQGDSAVIELPYRKKVYVIDTGGVVRFGEPDWRTPEQSFQVGKNIVVPYLKGRGITKIDVLSISHAHLDHMEGADEVMEEVRVKEVHIPPGSDAIEEMNPLLHLATEQHIPIIAMKDEVAWQVGGYQFDYMAPQEGPYVGNDSSLALLVTTPEQARFLFTGDMELEAERKFVEKYNHYHFETVILKAGHHGSRTSSTEPFIQLVKPQIAIISAGLNNHYGHPHKEVLETFKRFDIPVLVTADEGSITVRGKRGEYSVETMRKK